jgi:hypothetical protein
LIHDIIAVHAFLSPVQTYFKNINSSWRKLFIEPTEQRVSTKIRKTLPTYVAMKLVLVYLPSGIFCVATVKAHVMT